MDATVMFRELISELPLTNMATLKKIHWLMNYVISWLDLQHVCQILYGTKPEQEARLVVPI